MEIVVSNLIWPEQHHPQQQWNDSWKAIHHHLHLPAKHVVQSQKLPAHPFHHLLHHITTKQPIMTMIPLPKCHLHHLQNYWRFPNEWSFLFSLFFPFHSRKHPVVGNKALTESLWYSAMATPLFLWRKYYGIHAILSHQHLGTSCTKGIHTRVHFHLDLNHLVKSTIIWTE